MSIDGKQVGQTTCECRDNQAWRLVWSDEFDGPEINKAVWDYEIGYIRNNELQYYTDHPENAYIENGNLVLEAREEEFKGYKYTSASINTHGKKSWMYGKVEMRAKLPFGKGIWPAFWMMGDTGHWPACGEIDIMELVGGGKNDSIVYGTAHWDEEGAHKSLGTRKELSCGKFCDDYHTFSVEWDIDRIQWFIDGEHYFTLNIDENNESEFRRPHYILLNLAIGGNWPGSPDETTVFPQKYYIDYVRVYQK